MIRTFIACEIDSLTKEKIALVIRHLKKSNSHIKWATIEGMHFTLKFLGDVKKDKAKDISKELDIILKNHASFNITFSKIGGFPDLNKPRVLWLGIKEGEEYLKELNLAIEDSLNELGFPKEKREFKPHLTLGRVRSLKNIEELKKIIEKLDLDLEAPIRIYKLMLYKSTLTQKGAAYTPLSTHLLK